MFVTPTSNVSILKAISWNLDRKHVRVFAGATAKTALYNYMVFHAKYSYTDFTYVREQQAIRVPRKLDDLYDCNYIMYQNEGFGNKWFYAFITGKKFYNSEMTEISFEIDDFTTWFYDCNVPTCYVEREHVADDTIGAHTLDEGLGTGELVPIETYNRFWDKQLSNPDPWGRGFNLVLQVKPTLAGALMIGDGLQWNESQITPIQDTFDIDDATSIANIRTFIHNYSLTGCEISRGYMYPKEFDDGNKAIDVSGNGIKRPTKYYYYFKETTDSYTPKNNKLFTYPYTKLVVSTHEGKSKEYKWENTTTGKVDFRLIMNKTNVPSCALYPTNLFSTVATTKLCNTDAVTINEFPEVNLGQYKNLLENGINLASSLATGNFLGVISNATGLATQTQNKDNSTTGNNLALKYRHIGFTFQVMGLTAENAKIIDSYLSRFGYKVNQIKVPELYSRKSWNYVKTKEIDISGNIPADSAQAINDMFNSGVTLWHINDVGNFSADNSIVS